VTNSKAEKESVLSKRRGYPDCDGEGPSRVIDDDGRGRSGSPRFFCLDLLGRGTSRALRERAFS
jgi:hypothetical protein